MSVTPVTHGLISRKQLEALHRALPDEWTDRDTARSAVMEAVSLPEWDRAAGEGLLASLSLAGIAQRSGHGKLWRRGVLPPDVPVAEALRLAEEKRLAELRQDEADAFERRINEQRRLEARTLAPERAARFAWIDERLGHWLAALGFDENQIAAARAQLPNPLDVLAEPHTPPRTVHHLPLGAQIATVA